MEEQTPARRQVALGVGAVAGAIGLSIGLFAALPASAEHVTPEEVEGNPTCGDLAPEGAEWTEFKIDEEDIADDDFTDGTLEVTLTLNVTGMGPTFDWESNIGVDAVFVKGGNVGGNFYLYDPPAEETADTGLHAPLNPSDEWAGLSHISFCYDVERPPPDGSTTTTTTTQPERPEEPEEPEAPPAAPKKVQPTFTG